MAYMIYMTPTVEGTLIGGLVTIIGCGSGVVLGFLLMNWKQSAMEPYGLGAIIVVVTTVAVYFMNGPFYSSLLTTCTTMYVIILYQYSPYEYKATWHYPLARFVNISLGIIIAVILSEFILPHSALMEARKYLAMAVRKMSRWHRWLLFDYFELMGQHKDQDLVYGSINVQPIGSLQSEKLIILQPLKTEALYRDEFKREDSFTEKHQSTCAETIKEMDSDNIVTWKRDPMRWKQEILADFNKALFWLSSVQNGVSAKLHAIPKVILTAVEYEKRIIPRLSAFLATLEYQPFLTGHFNRTHYDLFIKPLMEDFMLLQESRKHFTEVIVSCILEGKPFNSVAFVKEFGYASARETTKAAWFLSGYMKTTGTSVFKSLSHAKRHVGNALYANHVHTSSRIKQAYHVDERQTKKKQQSRSLESTILEINQLSNDLKEKGLLPSIEETEEPLNEPMDSGQHLSRNLSNHKQSLFKANEDISGDDERAPEGFNNISETVEMKETPLNQNVVNLADIFNPREETTERASVFDAGDQQVVNLPSDASGSPDENTVEGNSERGVSQVIRATSLRRSSLRRSSVRNNKAARQNPNKFWSIISKLNTGSDRFGTVSHNLLEAILSASKESDIKVPPIVENLREGVKQVRVAQAKFYARYLQLEHTYYQQMFEQANSDVLKSQSDQTDPVPVNNMETASLYDTPYIRSADDHILFLSSFFASSYVFDAFKELGMVLADAVWDDLQDMWERHHVLVKKGLRKLERRMKRRRKIYNRKPFKDSKQIV
eukprot:jgi/Galph1/3770/GphlegSOOS_G2411.1